MFVRTPAGPARADVGEPLDIGSYEYGMTVTFSGYAGTSALSNFPALVVLNTGIDGFDYAQFQPGGHDLRFADASGVELSYETDTWNTSGVSFVWVCVPRLSSSTDFVRAYWGNPLASQPAYTTNGTTWSSYAGVWHMREAAAVDSTALRNKGTTGGGVSTVAGLVGSAQSLTNSGWIGVSAVANDVPGSTFAISGFIWTTFDGAQSGSTPFSVVTATRASVLRNRIGGSDAPAVPAGETALVTGATPTIAISTGVRVDTGAWRHIAYVRNGGTGTLYIDGVSRGTHTATQTYATTDQWHFGRGRYQVVAWSGYFIGRLDEMRVAAVARTGTWVVAEDATARNNAAFTTYSEVTRNAPPVPVRLTVESPYGNPVPPAGTNGFTSGATVTCSVSPAAITAPGGTTQYVCTGWTGTGIAPGSGASTTFTLTNDATLTWLWQTNVWLSGQASAGGWVFGANRWLRLGSTSHVDAVTFGHYRFDGWTGDAPTNQASDDPLEMAMDRARSVEAAFAVNTDTNGAMERPSVSFSGQGALSLFQASTNRLLNGNYTQNMSGVCLLPSTGELLVILNSPPTIQVYTTNGVYRRAISLSGFSDTEGLCLYDAASNRVAIVEEGSLDGHSDICIVTVRTNTTSIAKTSATMVPAPRPVVDNNGWEGVTFDAANRVFYLVKERVPMGVFRVFESNGAWRTEEIFDATAALAGVCTDISDLRYDPESGRLWILSDESRLVMECDLAGRVMSTLPLTAGQPEGLELMADRRTLFVVGEPNQFFRYERRASQGRVDEGDGVTLTATLSWPWTGTVAVAVQSTGGLAIAGQDFSPSTGLLAFAAGVTSRAFRIDARLDAESEPEETFTVSLVSPSNAVLGDDSRHVETILANAIHDTPEWWLAGYGATGDLDEAALADADGDGADAWQEYRAGTEPDRAASVLRITGIALRTDGAAEVAWSGGSNRVYRAERAGDMGSTPPSVIASNIPAAATGLLVDPGAATRTGGFYRIAVEWPAP